MYCFFVIWMLVTQQIVVEKHTGFTLADDCRRARERLIYLDSDVSKVYGECMADPLPSATH